MPKRRQKAALSETAFERRAQDLRLLIRDSVTPFENDSARKKKARIARARVDRDFFARTYFPHIVTQESPEFHIQLDEASQQKRAAVEVFRGGAKTTRVFNFGSIHDVIFKAEDYIQYFTSTNDAAEAKLDQVRAEFETNVRLQNDFGLAPGHVWRSDRIIINDVCVDAMGLKSAIRGMTDHKGRRPTKVVVDDPDDDENVESPKQREKLLRIIFKAIIPGMDPTRGKFLVIGTPIHPECTIEKFMTEERFDNFFRVKIPVKDPANGEPAWAARFTEAFLEEMLILLGAAAFSTELLLQPIDSRNPGDNRDRHQLLHRCRACGELR